MSSIAFSGHKVLIDVFNGCSLVQLKKYKELGMSNVHLKVTTEKKLTFYKLRFSKFKKFVSRSVAPTHTDIIGF